MNKPRRDARLLDAERTARTPLAARVRAQIGADARSPQPLRHPDQAAVHAARLAPATATTTTLGFPGQPATRAASTRRCIAAAPGPSAS